jgi:hypothetical protein
MRICFPFLAQIHQAFHSLPIALEIAMRHRDVEVHLASTMLGQLDALRKLADAYAPHAPVIVDQLRMPGPLRRWAEAKGRGVPPKTLVLLYNARYFGGFDALVVPERTSLALKRFLPRTRFVWTRHGAGDRASGFEKEIEKFDFVLMSGPKIEQRLRGADLIAEGRYETGIYAKFDLTRRLKREPLFANGRPTVLYNPHFRPRLSSWPDWGRAVLDYFAASDRFNLVFAPHIRLFDPPTAEKYAEFAKYAALPNIRIDLGSMAAADMTYTMGADLYLGDVSSQVAEFLTRPRPCLFLNAHHAEWNGNPDYRFWQLGPVVEDIRDLGPELDRAFATHEQYRQRQVDYVEETFGTLGQPTSAKAADAIVAYLRSQQR